jgi:hypothetical protein
MNGRADSESPYIKSTGGASGTCATSPPASGWNSCRMTGAPRKQEQLIAKLVQDFLESMELYEYADYRENRQKQCPTPLSRVRWS